MWTALKIMLGVLLAWQVRETVRDWGAAQRAADRSVRREQGRAAAAGIRDACATGDGGVSPGTSQAGRGAPSATQVGFQGSVDQAKVERAVEGAVRGVAERAVRESARRGQGGRGGL